MLPYSDAVSVYGFDGASAAVHTGRTLHYEVNLTMCHVDVSPALIPEFAETFGGHVTTWRSFNEDLPFVVFYDQKMMYNASGIFTLTKFNISYVLMFFFVLNMKTIPTY